MLFLEWIIESIEWGYRGYGDWSWRGWIGWRRKVKGDENEWVWGGWVC